MDERGNPVHGTDLVEHGTSDETPRRFKFCLTGPGSYLSIASMKSHDSTDIKSSASMYAGSRNANRCAMALTT